MTTPELIAILDTETTGLEGEVIEIAVILYHLRLGVVGQVSTIIPFGENGAEKINRIPTPLGAFVGQGSHHSLALELVAEYLDDADVIAAHNAPFDLARIMATPLLESIHFLCTETPWIDTCHGMTWPAQTRKSSGLTALALAHGLGVSSAHRALTDCDLIARLFDQIRKVSRFPGMVSLADLIAEALLPRFTYRAEVSFAKKALASEAGFRWDGKQKLWLSSLTEAEAERGFEGFKVTRI